MQNPHPSGSIARQVVRGQAEYLERATLAENPASQGPSLGESSEPEAPGREWHYSM